MSNLLYAATGSALARVVDADGDSHAEPVLARNGVQCVAVDPNRPDHVYAGSRGEGLWRSLDGGASWEDARLPARDVFSVAVSPVDRAVYAGCEPSMLYRSGDAGATWQELSSLREIPSAPTWSFPPRPWTSHVRAIAPSPHDASLLLVGIELGGLMYSADGGATWSDHRPVAQRDVHAVAWHPTARGRAYEAGGGGAAWSSDGGWTWQPADAGRDRHYTWAVAVDPAEPDSWYVSASFGPRYAHSNGDARAKVYRWRGGGPWQPVGPGLPDPLDSMPYALAALPQGVVYAGLKDGRIYRSDDGGDTWRPVAGTSLPGILALAVVP